MIGIGAPTNLSNDLARDNSMEVFCSRRAPTSVRTLGSSCFNKAVNSKSDLAIAGISFCDLSLHFIGHLTPNDSSNVGKRVRERRAFSMSSTLSKCKNLHSSSLACSLCASIDFI